MKPDMSHFDRPAPIPTERFDDAEAAVARLEMIYDKHTAFIRDRFAQLLKKGNLRGHVRATYPQIRIETTTFAKIDSRLSYGHVAGPGVYATTVTRPRLFGNYLEEQIRLILRAHNVPVEIGPSDEPIPLHFAFPDGIHVEGETADRIDRPLRDMFDVPDLAVTDDAIVNGTFHPAPGNPLPLAPFTAQRVDYSLHRLAHYTATKPEFFQNFIIFTNYQFYIDEFVSAGARRSLPRGGTATKAWSSRGT